MNKEAIYKKVKYLNYQQQLQFCFFCLDRISNLYSFYEDVPDEKGNYPNGEKRRGILVLNSILETVKSSNEIPIDVQKSIKEIYSIAPAIYGEDECEGGIWEAVAAMILDTYVYALKFVKVPKSTYLNSCFNFMLDIVNCIAQYYVENNIVLPPENLLKKSAPIFDNEIKITCCFIELLKENVNQELLNKYISDNIITKDGIRKFLMSL